MSVCEPRRNRALFTRVQRWRVLICGPLTGVTCGYSYDHVTITFYLILSWPSPSFTTRYDESSSLPQHKHQNHHLLRNRTLPFL